MKREGIAGALLVLLFLAALVNIACLDRLISRIEAEVDRAQTLAEHGEFSPAEEALDTAIVHWTAANSYTHIFIRHPEIDSTSDAFYECKQLLAEENADGFPSAFEKLNYHLNSIDEMEHIRLGSVL